jgi:hypothetical protein
VTALLASLCVPAPAAAQESTNVPAGTQPSVGRFYLRQRVQYLQLRDDPSPENREIDKIVATTSLAYGLRRDLSIAIELPVAYEHVAASPDPSHPGHDPGDVVGSHDAVGFNDVSLSLKWRPWQRDLGPIDSLRFALIGGVELPSGHGDFSSHSFDPFIGGVFTAILGRNGFNIAASYKLNTGGDPYPTRAGDGPDDAVRLDASYLFRLSPAEYSADTTAATYLTFEANGLYETGGDLEVIVGPGLLYEARTFAIEATVGLPIVQDVDERPETELVFTLGARFLW